MAMNISCKFEKSTYNTLASRGVTRKSLHTAAAAYSCVIHSIQHTVNLSKSDFVKAKVTYIGHEVGHGVVTPIKAKVKSIIDYPIPENKKSLMRFL